MYDYNITAAEIAAFTAEMWEMQAEKLAPPSDEEMEEMAAYYGEA